MLFVFQRSSPASSKKLVVKVVLGLVTLTLIVAATLTAVFLGGKITKEAVQESFFTFRMPDGTSIKEKVTVAGAEEDITVLGQDTRIIYDYSKGYMVMRTKDDGVNKCFISTFDRTQVKAPVVSEDKSMMNSNVTQLPEMDYFVQKNTVVDAAILSPRSRDMCQGLPVYWMTRSMKSAGLDTDMHRQKRGCRRVCRFYCSCCPRDCGVQCNFQCSF